MSRREDSAPEELTLERWLSDQGVLTQTRTALTGDISRRTYARFETAAGGTLVLASYPPSQRAVCRRFEATSRLLAGLGIRVPRIVAPRCDQGWMLLEDLGPETLYDQPTADWGQLAAYFEFAIEASQRIATLPVDQVAALSPPLDSALLTKELHQTYEVFLRPEGLLGEGDERSFIERALGELCIRLGEATPIPCHRDLMVRNLVPVASPRDGLTSLAVLDHQDLRLGPPGYDLASLLNDSLFPPQETESRLLKLAFGKEPPYLDYHRAAVQRTLKAVGSYAAFARRGFNRHIPLIAPTLARALLHLRQLPEQERLFSLVSRRWAAAAA